jgi:hypothetical protein
MHADCEYLSPKLQSAIFASLPPVYLRHLVDELLLEQHNAGCRDKQKSVQHGVESRRREGHSGRVQWSDAALFTAAVARIVWQLRGELVCSRVLPLLCCESSSESRSVQKDGVSTVSADAPSGPCTRCRAPNSIVIAVSVSAHDALAGAVARREGV